MPTQRERLCPGIGAGVVVRAAGARVGGIMCWENQMQLARYRVYRGGPQIWVAPTADDFPVGLPAGKHVFGRASEIGNETERVA